MSSFYRRKVRLVPWRRELRQGERWADGIEFVTKLRGIPRPKKPVVVFWTSNGEAKDIHDGIAAGADDYIVKPFDEAALKARLEKLGRG